MRKPYMRIPYTDVLAAPTIIPKSADALSGAVAALREFLLAPIALVTLIVRSVIIIIIIIIYGCANRRWDLCGQRACRLPGHKGHLSCQQNIPSHLLP